MKKLISLFVLFALCFSLAACDELSSFGGYDDDDDDSGKSSQSSNKNSGTTDPNGFSSLDQLMDVYIRMRCGQGITKNELKKMYTEYYWDNVIEQSLNETYSEISQQQSSIKDSYSQQYGSNYKVTYKITSKEADRDASRSYTQDEIDECKKMFGCHPKDMANYMVYFTITISGSKGEKTARTGLTVRKIGSKWYMY